MVQKEGMVVVVVVAVAMLMQAMVLSEAEHTALVMPAGAVVSLLLMTGLTMIGAMVVGMHTAVGAQQHQSGKEHIPALVLKGNMQDLQPGHQARMRDRWQAYHPDSPHLAASVSQSQL